MKAGSFAMDFPNLEMNRSVSRRNRVRQRFDNDPKRPRRFEEHSFGLEIQEIEVQIVAAGADHVARSVTDLSVTTGVEYETLVKYLNGTRMMPMDIVAAMRWASRRVAEAREWCIAVARELLPDGWTLTPPPIAAAANDSEIAALITEVSLRASSVMGKAYCAIADEGTFTANQAAERAADVQELRRRVVELEAALRARAGIASELGDRATTKSSTSNFVDQD